MKQKTISEIQVQLPVTKQIEGHSVVRGRSTFGDGGTMFFSRVSFILIPVIKRIFFVKTIHIIISVGFSQYRSGGYREVFSVSFYHGSMRNVRIFIETVSVDQQMLRTDRELIDSPVHRQKGTVTWVPVSPRRLRQRGYDQARLLAESACRLWETKPLPLLRKTVHNPAQSGLKEAAARRANVLGVYEAVDPERISGHRILLVDDICTTGATLAECARVLREAGAADVVCAAAALTPLERDSGKKA